MWIPVCVVVYREESYILALSHDTHRHAEGAGMDLSGDTQIWLVGLIGF